MTALLPALTLLIGLAIGALVGIRLALRRSGAESLDVDRTRDIANATLATTMRELIDVNTRQQAEANARSAAEAVQQQKSVHDLVAPVGEQLARLDQKLNDLENKRVEDSGRLNSSIGSLSSLAASLQKETAELASAMKNTKVRGNWGELQLQRVIELAGMTEHVMNEQQEHIAGDGDSARPDMTVRLLVSTKIATDAKSPKVSNPI